MVAAETPPVFLVDHDPSMRKSLTRLLNGAGWEVESFASGQEFLAQPRPDRPSCLLLDVRMPGLTGPDLQDALAEVGERLSIVFLTGLRDRREQARVKEIRDRI
jgi:FixJ family two-component response regulator